MAQTLKLFIILTLVIGFCSIVQTIDRNSLTASAESELTWEALNETVSKLKTYINGLFENYTEEMKDYINERIIINSSENITNITYNLEFNEQDILKRLDNITSKLGNYKSGNSIYDDLSSIIVGITYVQNGHTKYVLREGNESIFKTVFENQVGLSNNQQQIVNKISLEHNYTRNYTNTRLNDVGGQITSAANNIITNSGGDGWYSVIGCIGIIFLLLWIFFIKPRIQRRYSEEPEKYFEDERNERIASQPKREMLSKLTSINPFRLKAVKANEPPPSCYIDGVSYDPLTEIACNSCSYSDECSKEKMRVDAQKEIEKEQQRQNQLKASPVLFGKTLKNSPQTLNTFQDEDAGNINLNPEFW